MQNHSIDILLADDDETDCLLFTEAFQELKIKTNIHTVNDGEQLMEYLNKQDSLLPNLLFLDLNMPRKNGIDCLKEIRSNNKFANIAIAIYSTSASEKDMEETFHNGANIYIKKPDDFNTLKQVLEKAVITTYLFQDNPFNKENFLLRI